MPGSKISASNRLQCNLCGDVFTAAAPPEVGNKKYDETAASMIALLRYGDGFPWTRLKDLEESLSIPLPTATQCEIVAETAVRLRPVFQELVRQAAQGEAVHNDGTSTRVLSLYRTEVSPERVPSAWIAAGAGWIMPWRSWRGSAAAQKQSDKPTGRPWAQATTGKLSAHRKDETASRWSPCLPCRQPQKRSC